MRGEAGTVEPPLIAAAYRLVSLEPVVLVMVTPAVVRVEVTLETEVVEEVVADDTDVTEEDEDEDEEVAKAANGLSHCVTLVCVLK